jgi:hypothetical protein
MNVLAVKEAGYIRTGSKQGKVYDPIVKDFIYTKKSVFLYLENGFLL